MPAPKVKELTLRERLFVKYYLTQIRDQQDAPNATEAAKLAGYSPKTAYAHASKMLKKKHIREEIDKEIRDLERRVEITQEDVLKGLHSEATYRGEGSSHGARVSAWTAIGKHLGMFVERRMVGLKRIEDMTEEELAYFLGESDNAPG